MVLPLVGAALLAGGTASQLYGTNQRGKATSRALKDYQEALAGHASEEQNAANQESSIFAGLGRQHQNDIGSYINDFGASMRPQDDGFHAQQTGILNDIHKLTGGNTSDYAYAGAPRVGAEAMQGGVTGNRNRQIAEAMLAEHQQRQMQEHQQFAQHRLQLGDLLRSAQSGDIRQKFQLAKALRDLDWQRKTAALQGHLDDAGRKGQWFNVLGGLGQQVGGMALMAGMGGAEAAGGAAAPVAGEASGAAAASEYGQAFDPAWGEEVPRF